MVRKFAIKRFFAKSPAALPLFESLYQAIVGRIPGVELRIQKTQIAFTDPKTFACVWLPIRHIKGRPEIYIILTIGLDRLIESPRIKQAVQPYPNRWTHHILIQDKEEIDQELMNWIKEAHVFSRRKRVIDSPIKGNAHSSVGTAQVIEPEKEGSQ